MRKFAAVLICLSTPAMAEPWKCELHHSDLTVITKQPFEVAPGQLQKVGFTSDNVQAEFQTKVKAVYGVEVLHNYYGCGPAPADWDAHLKQTPNAKLLDWKPSFIAGSPAGLIVEEASRPRSLDDDVLQAQRDGAAALAKRVADTARQDAAIQAQFEKFMAELRKRGSAQ